MLYENFEFTLVYFVSSILTVFIKHTISLVMFLNATKSKFRLAAKENALLIQFDAERSWLAADCSGNKD